MNWKQISAIIVGTILFISALLFIIKKQHDLLERSKEIETSVVKMKQLDDDFVRHSAEYTDNIEKHVANLNAIKGDLEKLNADIQSVSNVISKTSGFQGSNISSTSTTPRTDQNKSEAKLVCKDGSSLNCPNPDTYGYLDAQQNLKLEEPFSKDHNVPWGSVGFSAWKKEPWDLTILPRTYHLETILAVDENNRHYAYSHFQIEVDGKKYDVQINDAQFVEQYPSSKFRFGLTPMIGMDLGIITNQPLHWEFTPNLQVALFSYGKTRVLPQLILLGLGAGYETQTKTLGFVLSPINYNLAGVIPFLNNLYIGPSIGLDLSGNFSIMGGIRVSL